MEAELKQSFVGMDITLISSGGGVFEVTIDGDLIFSKKALDRFPEKDEIVRIINQR